MEAREEKRHAAPEGGCVHGISRESHRVRQKAAISITIVLLERNRSIRSRYDTGSIATGEIDRDREVRSRSKVPLRPPVYQGLGYKACSPHGRRKWPVAESPDYVNCPSAKSDAKSGSPSDEERVLAPARGTQPLPHKGKRSDNEKAASRPRHHLFSCVRTTASREAPSETGSDTPSERIRVRGSRRQFSPGAQADTASARSVRATRTNFSCKRSAYLHARTFRLFVLVLSLCPPSTPNATRQVFRVERTRGLSERESGIAVCALNPCQKNRQKKPSEKKKNRR
ncbi:hypothetical protein MRX96_016860 [Rhipicephalus microplus]